MAKSPLYWLQNHTVLARFGHFVLLTYALLMGTGFLVGCISAGLFAVWTGIDPMNIIDLLLFFVLPGLLIGARGLSSLLDIELLLKNPKQALLKPGFMLHGGIIGGAIGMFIASRIYNWEIIPIADCLAIAVLSGEIIGRLGCFNYGCCWGRKTDHVLGLAYESKEAKVIRCHPELHKVKLHPAQLYTATAAAIILVICLVSMWVYPAHGLVTVLFLVLHPPTRLFLETFREDDRGTVLNGKITHTQIYSALLFLAGVSILITGNLTPMELQWTGAEPVLGNMAFWMRSIPVALAAAIVFGLHYGEVGHWLRQSHKAEAK